MRLWKADFGVRENWCVDENWEAVLKKLLSLMLEKEILSNFYFFSEFITENLCSGDKKPTEFLEKKSIL